MSSNNRVLSIDYAKAFGIIVVVLGHYPVMVFDTVLPYYYHMPLFFFIGGLCMKTEISILNALKKTFINYYIYIVILFIIIAALTNMVNAFFSIPHTNILASSIIDILITTLKSNFHNNTNFLVAWFLFAYSITSILSLILAKVFQALSKKIILPMALIIGYIGMTYTSSKYSENGLYYYNVITQILVGIMYYMIGYACKNNIQKAKSITLAIISFLVLFISYRLDMSAPMEMAWSKYPFGFVTQLITSFSGIYIIIYISNILAKSNKVSILTMIGKSSKYIMSYHMFIFFAIEQILFRTGIFEYMDNRGINKPIAFLPINIISALFIPILIKYFTDKSFNKVNVFYDKHSFFKR
ncbi:acyltransferase family protein [Photorhabdus akhurstii]|uniref:acyltransferase family protein n=1 Tax=Photorhabdus akhurstii TaxID=171438 RepID=UPI0037044A0E